MPVRSAKAALVTSLWFAVPAHGRLALSAICLKALAWTCNQLADHGIHATACIVANDDNISVARQHGFWTIERDNRYLGAKVNDALELAAAEGANYVVTFASDTWVDPELIADLRGPNVIACARLSAAVSENGERVVQLRIPYPGGDGVRVIPVPLLRRVAWRPAAETRNRGIDGSIRDSFERATGKPMPCVYRDLHPLQIVDFKSSREQLTSFAALERSFSEGVFSDPFERLARVYPADLVAEVRALYGQRVAA